MYKPLWSLKYFAVITVPQLVCSCGGALLRVQQESESQPASESLLPIPDQEDTETGHQEV